MPSLLRARVGPFLALALVFAACDNPLGPDDDLEEARQKWGRQGYTSYRFVVRQLCFCAPDASGPFAVVVLDGRVASVTSAVSGAPATPPGTIPLTVPALFAAVEDAIDTADEVEVRYHPDLGYPAEIAIDRIRHAVDDEVTFLASDLTPLR
jgi:hypothetical protein